MTLPLPSCPEKAPLEQFENAGHLCSRKPRSGKSNDYCDAIVFEKRRFKNVFRPHENEKPTISNSSGFEEHFRKAPLSWRISLDGRPNRRNKAAFSNFPV